MRLAIFTHVLHQPNPGEYSAYAPYVREMNLWLRQVDEVEVVAPHQISVESTEEHNLKNLPYRHSNLTFTDIPTFDFLKLASAFKSIFIIPTISFRIIRAMRGADHLHLRCPGNIGLLASICQIFFPHKPKTAKYAGNWDPNAKQPWTYKLQKWIISNTFLTRNMKVLAYGDWPDQSQNILPFFTASFSDSEIEKIEKKFSAPFKFLFVGNLVSGKQPLFALKVVRALRKKNIEAELHVYGEGPLKNDLEKEAENKDYIHLHGNKPLEVLKQAYKDAHFLILASKSEGWPKAVAEGMFFGCIPIVTTISCVPWMINYGSRGILIPEVRLDRGERTEDRVIVEGGLRDTFQKNRQFECFPETAEAVTENVSRTGFSETLEVTSGKNKERQDVLKKGDSGQRILASGYVINETVDRIIDLIQDQEEMKGMSLEAQEWSQEYTLEKFEEEIKNLLAPLPILIGTKKGEQKRIMRVLQLIDSLRPGGAEKMAVNIANALLPHVERSYLCCTRQEGLLKKEINPEVQYLFLNKKSSLDPKAILKLRNFVKVYEINIIHVHSNSYFLAGLIKLSGSKFKLIWHDHYGESENLEARDYKVLKKFSRLFSGIISVNTALKEWAIQKLNCQNVIEIRNFIPEPDPAAIAKIQLKGNKDAFKIICVANLRPQKDHFNLLRAFELLEPHLNVSLHLIGEDPETAYSGSVLKVIKNSPFKEKIFYYGTQPEVISLLKQAELGVLSSRSEGLPLALLEYGMAGLPVICTKVGKCEEVVGSAGKLVERENSTALAAGIKIYIDNGEMMKNDAARFKLKAEKFSESKVLPVFLKFFEKC